MKKEIVIQVPDNLTPEKEAILVSKELLKKAKLLTDQSAKQIGDAIRIIEPETLIRVKRVITEKHITMCTCSVCGTIFQSNIGVPYWTNYGGNPRKKLVCAEECRATILSLFPDRTAPSRQKLVPLRFW
jgi:hypothetical protein